MRYSAMFRRLLLAVILIVLVLSVPAQAQDAADAHKGTILLTIFLRHDQSKTLDEINAQLERSKFREKFPPKGVDVVSWYIMMGIGQVVTVRLPAEQLRAVNRAIEESAWGAYRTDFYATYDYKSIWEASRAPTK
jgi:hypothetical protein